MTDFAERLKELRYEKDMSQSEVAERLFVTKQAVSKWEKGNSLPDIASLEKLAELYDVTVDYILTGEENSVEKTVQIVSGENGVVEYAAPMIEDFAEINRGNEVKRFSAIEEEKICYRLKEAKWSLIAAYSITAFSIFYIIITAIFFPYGIIVGIMFFIPAVIGIRISKKRYEKEKDEIEAMGIIVDKNTNKIVDINEQKKYKDENY